MLLEHAVYNTSNSTSALNASFLMNTRLFDVISRKMVRNELNKH